MVGLASVDEYPKWSRVESHDLVDTVVAISKVSRSSARVAVFQVMERLTTMTKRDLGMVENDINLTKNTDRFGGNLVKAALTIFNLLLLTSCLAPDGNVGSYEGHKVGSVYVTLDDLLLLDADTSKARITIPSFQKVEEDIGLGPNVKADKTKIPSSTRIRLESVYRTGRNSWNTGTYYTHTVKVRFLDGPFSNSTAEAAFLFIPPERRTWDDRRLYIKRVE